MLSRGIVVWARYDRLKLTSPLLSFFLASSVAAFIASNQAFALFAVDLSILIQLLRTK